jgi:hypothetical protein
MKETAVEVRRDRERERGLLKKLWISVSKQVEGEASEVSDEVQLRPASGTTA